ncbi:M56 family metallopeptidase [Rhizosphaericola mali]|uniref:M56 family metallopeptidase n=1 Tax=Rhizosphaericola mali TaxID=2545455 RepID=A0A5P2G4H1_9BACT|nr:M56 family metallopeptidase [Rhizosphaericola mali]QES88660.1 M56 family metallopeptidase [Rhizosphaericola mali]
MNFITWQLLLKWLISFGLLFTFYMAFLQKLTFLNQRRFFLFFGTISAFVIPFLSLNILQKNSEQTAIQYLQKIPTIPQGQPVYESNSSNDHISISSLITYLVILGCIAFLVRFVLIILSLKNITKNAQLIDTFEKIRIYKLNKQSSTFSFGSKIFLGDGKLTEIEQHQILLHELSHAQHHHSIDTIWMEILIVLNWFNPFVWLLKKETRDNLEYLADKNVLKNKINKKEYQYLLLNTLLHNSNQSQISFTNNFNISSLKKRISMMNKNQTSKIHLWRIVFILPLIGILLLSFRKKEQPSDKIQIAGIVLDALTKKPVKGAIIKLDSIAAFTKTDNHGYYFLEFPRKIQNGLKYVQINISENNYQTLKSGYSYGDNMNASMIANFQLSPNTSNIGPNSSFANSPKNDYNSIHNGLIKALKTEKIIADMIKNGKIASIKDGTIYIADNAGSYLTLTPDNMEFALSHITINDTKKVTFDELNKNYKLSDFHGMSTNEDKINLVTKVK